MPITNKKNKSALDHSVSPWSATFVLLLLFLGLFIIFWSTGEAEKSRMGTYYLEHDQQGNLSIQSDYILMRVNSNKEVVSVFDLRVLGGEVMGNITYFKNGDFLFRSGEVEKGIKSYFSLAQLPPKVSINHRGQVVDINLDRAEKLRSKWVKDLIVSSTLNRCDIKQSTCNVFVKENIPWRYKLKIAEDENIIFLTESTKHKIKLLNTSGELIAELPIETNFPKRVRGYKDQWYVVDTNNHRIVFFDKEMVGDNSVSTDFAYSGQNVVPVDHNGRRWPVDVVFFDNHWWVINATSSMTNAELVLFDSNWHFVKKIPLSANAEPLDMLIFNNQLLVSDVSKGYLYGFTHAKKKPEKIALSNLMEYVKYLNKNKKFYQKIRSASIITLVFLLLLFFSITLWRNKNLDKASIKK